MPASPLEDFAKRHKSHFPATVGMGWPRPCSTTGETEAGCGPGEKPTSLVAVSPKCLYPARRRQPAITPRHRAGSCLRPTGLPRGAALLPGFGKREARGKKKNIPAGKPKGEDLGLQTHAFCPNFFPWPHATMEARGSAAPGCCHASSPPAQTLSSGCCSTRAP